MISDATPPAQILQEISDSVKAGVLKGPVAVVFDLDSTLFCVSPRSQMILRELGQDPEFSGSHAREAEVLRGIEVLASDWGIKTALMRSQIETSMDVIDKVRKHWRKKFFSSTHLHHDLLYPSALEFVNHIYEMGAEVFYLTGRNEGSMREGTLRVLREKGFPLMTEEHLLMKPSDAMADEGFKATVLKKMIQDLPEIWFFENEPLIIHLVREQVPQVRTIFVDTVHAGRAEKPTGLPRIPADFNFPGLKRRE